MMPRITVKLYGRFRDIVRKGELTVEAQNITELVEILVKNYGKQFHDELLDKEGKLRPFYNILVNGVRIDLLNHFDTELQTDNVVAFFSPVGGG